jgi:hypothetical protein
MMRSLVRRRRPTLARTYRRFLPDAIITCCAIASAVLATVANDIAWIAIWIGLAATLAVGALVDFAAVLEQDRRLRPIRGAVGRRIGKLHQILLAIVSTTFDDLEVASATDWPSALRASPEGPIDLSTAAKVYPPRTRQQRIVELRAELNATVEELVSLSAAGVLTGEVNRLDQALTTSAFLSLVRTAFAITPGYKNGSTIARDAADLLEQVQREMPAAAAAAAAAAGSSWRYGDTWVRR